MEEKKKPILDRLEDWCHMFFCICFSDLLINKTLRIM